MSKEHRTAGVANAPESMPATSLPIGWITPGRAAFIVSLLSFILYLLTMNRTFGFVDKGELVAVGSTLGIAHPTGYPTIMLLGFLFTKILPVRNVVVLNAMAALLTAAGAGMLTLLFDDLIKRGTARVARAAKAAKGTAVKGKSGKKTAATTMAAPATTATVATEQTMSPPVRALYAGLGALFMACTATWWNQANGFEVYSLHALMMPLVSLLFLRYIDAERARDISQTQPEGSGGMAGIGFTRPGFWFAFVLGLSFTNHLTTVLLAPAFIMHYIWGHGLKARAFARLLFLAPPFLLGLLPYAWLPIRASMHPRFNWGDPATLSDFWRHVTGNIYQTYMFGELKEYLTNTFGTFPILLGVGLILAVVIALLIVAARFNGWLSGGLAVVLAVVIFKAMFDNFKIFHEQTLFFLGNLPSETAYAGLALAAVGIGLVVWRNPMLGAWVGLLFMACILYSGNFEIMEIGPYYMTAIFAIGILCVLGLAWLHELIGPGATIAIAAILVALNCWTNFEESNESGNTLVEDMTVNMLNTVPKNTIIFSGQWDFWMAGSFYMQVVESARPDVLVIDPELLRRRWYIDELAYTYPDFMNKVKPEAEAFKEEVYKFDNDLPYDPNAIQGRYVGLMNAMIDRNIATRPVCVTGEVDPAVGAAYHRTPYHLTLRLMPDTAYVPEEFPNYRFAFWDHRVDGYTAKVYELYGRSALARTLYEAQHGHDSLAMRYYALCLGFDPGFTPKEIPSLPLNSEEQVTGMIGFFDQVRAMKR